MPKARLVPQQRKRRVRISKEASFPVPIATITGETASNSNWIYYTATLDSSGIMVHHTGDIEFLYRMGFFGKGSMSRGQPQWAESQCMAAVPSKRPGCGGWQGSLQARVTSRRRYMTHLKWHLLDAGDEETLTQVEQDMQVITEVPPPKCPRCENDCQEKDIHGDVDSTGREQDKNDTEQGERRSDDEMEVAEERDETDEHRTAEAQCFVPTGVGVKPSIDDWEDGEGDAEFWGTVDKGEESVCQTAERDAALQSKENLEGDTNFRGTQEKDTGTKSASSDLSSSTQLGGGSPKNCSSECMVSRETTGLSGGEGSNNVADRFPSQEQQFSLCFADTVRAGDRSRDLASYKEKDAAYDTSHGLGHNTGPKTDTDLRQDLNADAGSDTCSVCETKKDQEHTCAAVKSSVDAVKSAHVGAAKADCVETCAEDMLIQIALNSTGRPEKNMVNCAGDKPVDHASHCESASSESALDPESASDPNNSARCASDSPGNNTPSYSTDFQRQGSRFCQQLDSHNSDAPLSSKGGQRLFVIPDSDEEEETAAGHICRSHTVWKPVVRWDPFPVTECLHLSCEEAFFLSYGLGCLTVLDSQQTPVSLGELWVELCRRQLDFVPCYVAYHYYRSKNWVPKTGLKFGCTFLLYKDGPPFYHGSYSVVVQFVDEGGQEVEGFQGKHRQFSWTSLAGLKRITEHVGKELLLCYVVKPRGMTDQDLQSPACIPRLRIKEVLVSRWLSSQERENKALDDLP